MAGPETVYAAQQHLFLMLAHSMRCFAATDTDPTRLMG